MWDFAQLNKEALQEFNELMEDTKTFFDWFAAFNRSSNVSADARAVGNVLATRAFYKDLTIWERFSDIASDANMPLQDALEAIHELINSGWATWDRWFDLEFESEFKLTIPAGIARSVTMKGEEA